MKFIRFFSLSICLFYFQSVEAQNRPSASEAKDAMMRATRFMVEKVSTNGGYVAHYLPDMSRRWGELEGFDSQIWVQSPGTVSMGNIFLDAYGATSDEYYYEAAEKVANALIWGQQKEGGWNYIIDFAGDRSLRKWYATIGKNAWGFEEYNHYYGNSTFDDLNTSEPAEFLLRLYLIKKDVKYKPALDKAIQFVLDAQYPLGGWPQRYPLRYDHPHGKHDDYSSYYTFNDDVISGNIDFLINCYLKLNDSRLLDPIRRGMNFFIITQQGNPQGGWGQQYNMDLEPTYARSYEPAALLPALSYQHGMLLLKYYQLTADRKFIARIPDIISWLESSKLPADKAEGGTRTHATFIELGTNKGLYAHRTGTGVLDGKYWYDYDDNNLLAHYGGKTNVNIQALRDAYQRVSAISAEEIARNAPLKPGNFISAPPEVKNTVKPAADVIKKVINSLDQDRWLVKHVQISRPYSVDADGVETNTAKLSDVNGKGIVDASDQDYISTREYVKNMNLLISFIK
jgi:PelA/Pel-15E family pectate lyase